MGANAGAVTKMPKGKISKDGISINECVSELYLTISVGSLEIGPHYTEYTYEGKSEFTWCCVDDTFTIIGGELFLCYGIGAELNFNYKYFCEQVIEIYE